MTGPKASQASTSRREFLKTTTVAAAGTAALSLIPNAYARAGETIKVGLIGCGSRGRGAAEDICEAASITNDIKL
ncbi:MAG: twin-arginine translocation signal domain-containing protein, partial [Planctomycetaceae bacterium]|nr:twin-arginine translocation signal domain-containing protein [Planctomycetaceae bacterium]